MGPTEGDAQPAVEDTKPVPVLVTRLFRSFPAFVEEYASRVALSGAFITAVEPLPVGTTAHVDFQLRDGFRLFHGVGEVEWVRPASLGPDLPAGMGVRFLALDEKGRNLMLRMLEDHIKTGGQPFDLEPLPAGASTDTRAVPKPKRQLDGDDTLGLGFEAEATTVAPSMAMRESPVSEIVDVSFARLDPAAATSDRAIPKLEPLAEITPPEPVELSEPVEDLDLPASIDWTEETDLPELLTDPEPVAPTATEIGEVTDEAFDPPWKSELPDIPEEFLATEETVGGNELVAIAEAAEAASRVELALEPGPDQEAPAAPLFDQPSARAVVTNDSSDDDTSETLGDLTDQAVRFEVPDPRTDSLLPPSAAEPAMPTIDFGLESGAGPPLVNETQPAELPAPGIPLPTIPAAEPPRALGLEAPPEDSVNEPGTEPAPATSEPSPTPYWLDETGSAMRKPSRWPARVGAGLLVALLVTAALWFFRDRLPPTRETQAVSPPTAPPQADSGSAPSAAAIDSDTHAGTDDTTGTSDTSDTAPVTDQQASTEPSRDASPAPEPAPVASVKPAINRPPATLVTAIDWQETDHGTLLSIELNGETPMTRVDVSELGGSPPRILIRIRDIEAPYSASVIDVKGTAIRRIRTGYHPYPRGNELHVVIDLRSDRAALVGEVLAGSDGQLELLIAAL